MRRWAASEEESFRRTLDEGERLLAEVVRGAREDGTSWISAADAFKLHDTSGFPYDLTKELLAEEGLSVDDQGFEALMEEQRAKARGAAAGPVAADRHEAVIEFVNSAAPSSFVGYETLRSETGVLAAMPLDGTGEMLVKLEESPFYPEGGGQVSDSGIVRVDGSELEVVDVYRVGDDQAVRVRGEALEEGASAFAEVEHVA